MQNAEARSSRARPNFIEVEGRRLFILEIAPGSEPIGSVLYLPPFAEEMNRCRSHVAATARALASLGFRCVLLDHYATGESGGEQHEGDWDLWTRDALAVLSWMQQTGSRGNLTLWGARTGALLAAEAAARSTGPISQLLLWQPVTDGGLFLNQYLRLRLASQLVHAGEKETTELLKQRLAGGEPIEVAGYPLTQNLADGLAKRSLVALAALQRIRVVWMEMAARPEQPLAAASRKIIEQRLACGYPTAAEVVACPPIWQLHERAEAPALVTTTVRLVMGGSS